MNQILISTTMIGLMEGLLYAQKAGLNVEDAIAAVSQGAAGSWSLNNYSPRIVKGNYVRLFLSPVNGIMLHSFTGSRFLCRTLYQGYIISPSAKLIQMKRSPSFTYRYGNCC